MNSPCREQEWVFHRKRKELWLQGHKRFSFRLAVSKQQVTLLPVICSSELAPKASQQQGSVRCGLQFPICNSQFIYFHLGATSAPKLVKLCNMSTQEHEDARGNWKQGACKRVEERARSSLPTAEGRDALSSPIFSSTEQSSSFWAPFAQCLEHCSPKP